MPCSFNRTSMELKLLHTTRNENSQGTFNRTSMELKRQIRQERLARL